ncbi:TIGR03985 family CRISPR-associated protein [Anabaena cylindrica UHCC 0172]|uniref:TIGR03985 family CRISPR-associated protein n=1 Tax=Anabaena cylindrica TaxID=1165 RepID=UPI002B1EACB2|nr:TIGR03985 family CRISPR-associated protein [Anabaena cylindrica]MEA5554342.1 TIGR03985 family CRISPR-associated protein [Anabaena cylindrica UHCC 0172]
MNILSNTTPSPNILQQLANGSLDQGHNLTRAIRLWVLLHWLYSDQGQAAIGDTFTYTDWRQAFFTKTHKDEKQTDIINHQDPDCACLKTTRQWLVELEVSIDEWQNSLQQHIPVYNSDLEKLVEEILKERLFAQVRKSLQSDLDLLVSKNCLQRVDHVSGRSKYYRRVEVLPFSKKSENFGYETNLSNKKQAYLAGTLGMFSFLDPSLPLLAEELSEEEIDEDNHRVFLYADYVVPESSPIQDAVDEIQSELQDIWDSGKIQPLLLTYHSAHQNKIYECVVYPVCIYFMERAKYLCAYGKTPKGDINWYKYRLDRIISQQLEILDWEDNRVPQLLRDKYKEHQLPTPKTVNMKLKDAWGCDFYKEKTLMILRFDQNFHQNYIQGINIHQTFKAINHEQAKTLIKQNTPNSLHQHIVPILDSRSNHDAYYQVYYRNTDYYVIRRLRALGSKVEVLLPWELRQEMLLELQNTCNLYT